MHGALPQITQVSHQQCNLNVVCLLLRESMMLEWQEVML